MREAELIGTITCYVASHAMPTRRTTTTTPAAESRPRINALLVGTPIDSDIPDPPVYRVAASDSMESTR